MSCIVAREFLFERFAKSLMKNPRRHGNRAGPAKFVHVEILAHAHGKMWPASGDPIPRLGLGQGRWSDPDVYRSDYLGRFHGHVRRAAMQGHRHTRPGPRALGEHDETLAFPEHAERCGNHRIRRDVAAVTRGPHRTSGEWIAPQAVLDYASGIAREGKQEHDVDQRRMIRDDQLSRPTQSLGTVELVGQDAEGAHEVDEEAHASADESSGARPTCGCVRGKKVQHRNNQQSEQESAETKQGERQPGAEKSPMVEILPANGLDTKGPCCHNYSPMPGLRLTGGSSLDSMAPFQIWFATPDAAELPGAPTDTRPRTRREIEQAASRALIRHCAITPRHNTSLSHSHGHVALGIADRDLLIGVDIEYLRARNASGIAEISFHRDEADWLARLDEPERLLRFYELWTLKEAFAKALALDLLTALRHCRIRAREGGLQAEVPSDLAWSAVILAPRAEFRLAIVRMASDQRLLEGEQPETHEWPKPSREPWSVISQLTSSRT